VSVRIYVEGGFEGSTKSNCRKAFTAFLERVIPPGSFKVIASGSRQKAYEDFNSAVRQHADVFIVLLVESEAPVTAPVWRHLNARGGDNWQRPPGVFDEQAHLMVQVMESWFLADQEVLSTYYGQGFLRNSLPRQKDVEQIEKIRVFEALHHASRQTQRGRYHKTKHGFDLLELIPFWFEMPLATQRICLPC
jgi:hypothetical protein